MIMMLIDVKKAHLNGVVEEGEEVFVELLEEAEAPGKVGKLKRWLYGMRPAAKGWEDQYSSNLVREGFRKGGGGANGVLARKDRNEVCCSWR